MRTALVIGLFLLLKLPASAQFRWSRFDTADVQTNPMYVKSALAVSSSRTVYHVSLETNRLNYSTQQFGTYRLTAFDSSGNRLSSSLWGPTAFINRITAGLNGDLLVCGSFMDSLCIAGQTLQTVNSPAVYARNAFIACVAATGTIRWSRNLSNSIPGMEEPAIGAVDPNGNFLYVLSGFFTGGTIVRLASNGNDSISYALPAALSIVSDLQFDSSGSYYLAGALGQSTFTFGGLNVQTNDFYNRFLAKFDVTGSCRWFKSMRDITFQYPRISVNDSADIFFVSPLFDSLTVDGYFLHGPQWVYDYMVVRFDSAGAVKWAYDAPVQATITGDLQIAPDGGVAATADGCFLLLNTRGIMDFGNGVIVGNPQSVSSNGIAIVRFDDAGIARNQLTVATSGWLDGQQIVSSPGGNFLSAKAQGDLIIGSDTIDVNTAYSFHCLISRFEEPLQSPVPQLPAPAHNIRYVNPSRDGQLSVVLQPGAYTISITDMLGRIVYRSSLQANSPAFSITTDLQDGSYLVHLSEHAAFRWTIAR